MEEGYFEKRAEGELESWSNLRDRDPKELNATLAKTFNQMKKFMQGQYGELPDPEKKLDIPDLATSDLSKEPEKIQKTIQIYLQNLPQEYQLAKLNELQKKVGFLIVDPYKRKLVNSDKINYGHADLFRFLNLPLQYKVRIFGEKDGRKLYTAKVPKDKNPFYSPVKYNIPDIVGNNLMQSLIESNPVTLFGKIQNKYNDFLATGGLSREEITGGSKEFRMGNRMVYKNELEFKDILSLMSDLKKKQRYEENGLLDKLSNKRPMKEYKVNNLEALVDELMSIHPIPREFGPLPDKTDFTIHGVSAIN